MREQQSHQNEMIRTTNANQPFIQKKSHQKEFIKSSNSKQGFLHQETSFLSPASTATSLVQRKKNSHLPEELQTNMEQLLGHDFSNVDIQKNSQQAVQMNARAFTYGDSVHFAPNEFNPNSDKGKELIGHEFAHVKQQREGKVQPTVSAKKFDYNDDTSLEKEADSYGRKVANGNTTTKKEVQKSYIVFSQSPQKTIQKREVTYINYNTVAKDIYDAIDGPGTDEEKVYMALSKMRRNPAAINQLKSVYKKNHKRSLVNDIEGDFSGDELAHVQSLLATGETVDTRKEKTINYSSIAEKIHNAIDGPGTDEEAVYAGLLQLDNNPVLIDKLKKEYKSKYKVDLYAAIVGDFSGDELNYALELLKDKTKYEQVNVSSKTEATEAKKIIKSIKDDYGIDINSKAGIDAIKKDYPAAPKAVLDNLNTTSWEYKELVAVKAALDSFSPILGSNRASSKRKTVAQEVTSIGKVDQAIDDEVSPAVLDTETLGEYFGSSKNFSLFTSGTEAKIDFKTVEKQLKGTTIHEISHGLIEYTLPSFVAAMTYWLDENTESGIAGAEKPVTDYGETNASEDLAEAVMYYFVDNAKLLKDCPLRHQFIKNAIKNWK
ncbi:MAG: DUF4157 domain-containing protein [Bacteroidota bacterium]